MIHFLVVCLGLLFTESFMVSRYYHPSYNGNNYQESMRQEGATIKKIGDKIVVKTYSSQPLVVVIRSFRNNPISTYKEVSSDDPILQNPGQQMKNESSTWNILYPVVDIKLPIDSSLAGVVVFDTIQQTDYSVNGMFLKEKHRLSGDSLKISGKELFEWENNLYLEKVSGAAKGFILVDSLKPGDKGETYVEYGLLHPQWEGEIVVSAFNNEVLAKLLVEKTDIFPSRTNYQPTLSRANLVASLKSSIDFTLKSLNSSSNDPTKGGLYLFYDYKAKLFRRSTWPWSWGPSIKLLLEGANIPEISSNISQDSLQNVALEIGQASLRFQNLDKSSPAFGLATSRWSETKNMGDLDYDYEQFYSVADGQFLAGWGWMSLYNHLGDNRFLKATKLQTQVTELLMKKMGDIPMDYMEDMEAWKDYMISEQGFGMEGINELYRVHPDPKYREIGKDYLDMLLSKLDHPSGGWNRAYLISAQEAKEPLFYVRGHGWAMEGLTAGYELTQDSAYLAKAEKMAALLMEHQLPDGSWSVIFTQQDTTEISDKGTALWSLLFYRMYRFTKNEAYLKAARKALIWCLSNQYYGDDVMAHGSIPNISRSSGVIYRNWFPMACNYTTAFFGLAVLEELNLDHDSGE